MIFRGREGGLEECVVSVWEKTMGGGSSTQAPIYASVNTETTGRRGHKRYLLLQGYATTGTRYC